MSSSTEPVDSMMARTNSRCIAVDDVVIAVEQMFPELSETKITCCVVRDVKQRGGTIA